MAEQTGHNTAGDLMREALDRHMQTQFHVPGVNTRNADFRAVEQRDGGWRVYLSGLASDDLYVSVSIGSNADSPDRAVIRAELNIPTSYRINGQIEPGLKREVDQAAKAMSSALSPFGRVSFPDQQRGRASITLEGDQLNSVIDRVAATRAGREQAGRILREIAQELAQEGGSEVAANALVDAVAPRPVADTPMSAAERAELEALLQQSLQTPTQAGDLSRAALDELGQAPPTPSARLHEAANAVDGAVLREAISPEVEFADLLRQPLPERKHSSSISTALPPSMLAELEAEAGRAADGAVREATEAAADAASARDFTTNNNASGAITNTQQVDSTPPDWERHHSAEMGGEIARLDITDRFPNADVAENWLLANGLEHVAVAEKSGRFYLYTAPNDLQTRGAIDGVLWNSYTNPHQAGDLADLGRSGRAAADDAVDAAREAAADAASGRGVRRAAQSVGGSVARAVPVAGLGLAFADAASAAERGEYGEAVLTMAGEVVPVVGGGMTIIDVLSLGAAATDYLFAEPPTPEELARVRDNEFLNYVYENLPPEVTPGMPPQLAELVKAKADILAAEALPTSAQRVMAGDASAPGTHTATANRNGAIQAAEARFEAVYNELWAQGAFGNAPEPAPSPAPESQLAEALARAGVSREALQCNAQPCAEQADEVSAPNVPDDRANQNQTRVASL